MITEIIALIAALTGPLTIITTASVERAKTRNELRIAQMEIYETRRLDAIKDFADSFSKLYGATVNRGAAVRSALSATYEVSAYAPQSAQKQLSKLIKVLQQNADNNDIYPLFEESLGLICVMPDSSK